MIRHIYLIFLFTKYKKNAFDSIFVAIFNIKNEFYSYESYSEVRRFILNKILQNLRPRLFLLLFSLIFYIQKSRRKSTRIGGAWWLFRWGRQLLFRWSFYTLVKIACIITIYKILHSDISFFHFWILLLHFLYIKTFIICRITH